MGKVSYIVVFQPYGEAELFYGPFCSEELAKRFITRTVLKRLQLFLNPSQVEVEMGNPYKVTVTEDVTGDSYVFCIQKLYTKFEPGRDF